MAVADELLRYPFLWPHRWLLPLVRRGGGADDLGMLTHERGVVAPVVYLGNLVDVRRPEDLKALSVRAYPSMEALAEEWRVD